MMNLFNSKNKFFHIVIFLSLEFNYSLLLRLTLNRDIYNQMNVEWYGIKIKQEVIFFFDK